MPKGKAAEYAKYSCNFYVGCSNGCTYCYCKKGILAHAMGGNVPKLKACFKDEKHALQVFEKELMQNLPELQKHGLFFTFTSDPYLDETWKLFDLAIGKCVLNHVRCKVLTKRADWADLFLKIGEYALSIFKPYVAFGFTLTGHDELEPHASTNAERIEAMRKLHEVGFKTWASIEPVIDFVSSAEMMRRTVDYCDLYKIGLRSGKKYDKWEIDKFLNYCCGSLADCNDNPKKIYFKDSFLKQAGISRSELPSNCVDMDYNMFNH